MTPVDQQKMTVECLCRTRIPSSLGDFSLFYYSVRGSGAFHLAIAHGSFVSLSLEAPVPGESFQDRLLRGATPEPVDSGPHQAPALVRIHSSCLTSETFGSLRCDCSEQLSGALSQIAKVPQGLVIYLSQEGRGIGLLEKLKYAFIFLGMTAYLYRYCQTWE